MSTTEQEKLSQQKLHGPGNEDSSSITLPEGHGMGRNESILDADFVKHPLNRRNVLMTIGIGLNALVGLAIAAPVVGYILGPALRKKGYYKSWVTLGPVSKYPNGQTRLATFTTPYTTPTDGQTDNTACWVRRTSDTNFQVFAINCAHLGCPVRWFPQSSLFMCPCHGGVYYQDGSRAAGPPERGLFEYTWKLESGELHIDAGQLPTLANQAKLVQLKGNSPCQG
jgi:Rieske Fe-S protein